MLGVERSVAFDVAGAERLDHHRRPFVEPPSGLVHLDAAEPFVLASREPAAHPETDPTLRHMIEKCDLLSHPEWFVPRHDHRRGTEVDGLGDTG